MRVAEAWLLTYLLNALWQVPLVFAAAWLAARATDRNDPAMSHRIWVAALLLQISLPACSLNPVIALQACTHLIARLFAPEVATHTIVTVTMGPTQASGGLRTSPGLLAIVGELYLLVVACFLLRLAIGVYGTLRLHRDARPLTLTGTAGSDFARLQWLYGVSSVRVATSDTLVGPVVLGIRNPLLLLPCAMLHDGASSSVTSEDFEAALAHELAHVQRHDFAKNLLYQFVSLPIAFHPLLWLTRNRIAETRELLCDALAADAVNDRRRYARSLLRLASNFAERTRSTHFHAIGMFDANSFQSFERRVMNLTQSPLHIGTARRVAVSALAIALGLGACTSALALHQQVAAPAPQSAPVTLAVPRSETAAPVRIIVADIAPAPGSLPSPAPAPMKIRMMTPTTLPTDSTVSDTDQSASPLSVKGGVMAGNILTKVNPIYPQEAKDKHITGAVILAATIDKEGNISSLKLVSGPDELAKSAWEAVKQWKYKPYLLNGEPVEVDTTITVNYSLAN